MDITLLGTASAAGSVERDNTYMLLNHDKGCTMIDVGGNPLGKLKKLNIALDHITEVVFTHLHIDHIYGLPSLLWGMWIGGRVAPLRIYCSSEHERQLRNWLNVMETSKWPIQFEIAIHTYNWKKPSVLLKYDRFELSTFPSLHSGPTAGIKVVENNKVFIYSADSEPNEWIRRQPHIHLLIHEATAARQQLPGHSSLAALLEYYHLDSLAKLVLVHLTDGERYDLVLQDETDSVKQKVHVGSDLMTIKI